MKFSVAYRLLILILTAWIGLACLRTFYNLSKIFTEERFWVNISEEEKKQKLYGDIYPLYLAIDKVSKKEDCIDLYTRSDTSYFLLRYLLYPKKIYWVLSRDSAIENQNKTCKLVLLYNINKNVNNPNYLIGKNVKYQKIFEISSEKDKASESILFRLN